MSDKYNFSSFSVLIIDDNRFIRAMVVDLCRSFGFRTVMDVEDAPTALSLMRQMPFDFVICDWEMQPLDGHDFVKMIRTAKDSPNRFLPIIMLTGHTEVQRVYEARDAGVTEFLAKPISAKTLLTRFCTVIDKPRPFIQAPGYFGPDRRRRSSADYTGPERRGKQPTAAVSNGPVPDGNDLAAWGLSPEEIKSLMGDDA